MSTFANGADAVATASGTSLNVSSTVASGENIVVLVFYGSSSTITETVSDGVNTFTKVGTTLNTVGSSFAMFEALNVTGGTRNITFTLGSAAANRMVWYGRVATIQNIAAQGTRQEQVSPGTGTDAITSGNVTPASQPGRLIGVTITNSGAAIAAGTGFTNDNTLANTESTLGLRTRVEDKAIAALSAVGATFTATSGPGVAWSFVWYYPDPSTTTRGMPFGPRGTAFNGGRTFKGPIH